MNIGAQVVCVRQQRRQGRTYRNMKGGREGGKEGTRRTGRYIESGTGGAAESGGDA